MSEVPPRCVGGAPALCRRSRRAALEVPPRCVGGAAALCRRSRRAVSEEPDADGMVARYQKGSRLSPNTLPFAESLPTDGLERFQCFGMKAETK